MEIAIRPATEADTDACGRICYDAFKAVNEQHGFVPNLPSVENATNRIRAFLQHPSIFGVVAVSRADDRIVGLAFLSERDPVRAIGPVAVDPARQVHGVGRRLMDAVLERARGAQSVRLLQETFNMQSLALYASLGFEAKELFVALKGAPQRAPALSGSVRLMTERDVADCEALHKEVHGFTRTNELREALATGSPVVALRGGRVRAYMAVPTNWFANHGVAATEEDFKGVLLGAAQMLPEPLSFLLPVRHSGLFRWCLGQGFLAIKPMTLMTIGAYREPQGSYCPSVLY